MSPLTGTAAAESLVPVSPFAGADICREAGLLLPPGAARPVFEDDEWDFTHVIGLPVQLSPDKRRFGFTLIRDQRWRLVAKELIAALLAPRHEAVAPRLPHASPHRNGQGPARRAHPAAELAHPAGHPQPRRDGRRLLRRLAGPPPPCPRRGWHRDRRQRPRHPAGCGQGRH